jgi:hypothetical protein
VTEIEFACCRVDYWRTHDGLGQALASLGIEVAIKAEARVVARWATAVAASAVVGIAPVFGGDVVVVAVCVAEVAGAIAAPSLFAQVVWYDTLDIMVDASKCGIALANAAASVAWGTNSFIDSIAVAGGGVAVSDIAHVEVAKWALALRDALASVDVAVVVCALVFVGAHLWYLLAVAAECVAFVLDAWS